MTSGVATLIGGPKDGEVLAVPEGRTRVYVATPLRPMFVQAAEPPEEAASIVEEYELAHCLGGPSRDDEGRLRFVYRRKGLPK